MDQYKQFVDCHCLCYSTLAVMYYFEHLHSQWPNEQPVRAQLVFKKKLQLGKF